MRRGVFALAVAMAGVLAVPGLAQNAADATFTRVALPADFATSFKLYDKVDKPDRKIVRYLYINQQALAAVKPGEPFPDGTILVMADHDIALEAGGAPLKSADGRLMPTQRLRAIAVMEKRAGLGRDQPFPRRQGQWRLGICLVQGGWCAQPHQAGQLLCVPFAAEGARFHLLRAENLRSEEMKPAARRASSAPMARRRFSRFASRRAGSRCDRGRRDAC